MKLDPLTSAYLKVIEENASNGAVEASKKQVGKTFGDSSNDSNVKPKEDGLKNASKDLKKVEQAPAELTTDGSESEPKELKKGEKLTLKGEAKNPFDALFNKIISEDSFDFSTDEDNSIKPDDNFGGPEGIGASHEDEEGMGEEDEEGMGEEESEEESLEELVTQLDDLVSKLKVKLDLNVGEDEDEFGEDEDEFPEDSREDEFEETPEEEDENLSEESVEMEELSDEKGLSLTNKSSYTVKGAVPVTKKKAQVVKGKKVNGKLEDFKNEGGISGLQAKNNNVGGVSTGKYLFDQ
jgi:hypothetical protein